MSSLSKPTLNKASAALSFAEAKTPTAPKSGREARVFNAPEGYRRLTINLPEALHKKLRLAAVEDDCTATEIIERLLNRELS
jgi:hypothetical protein